MGRTDGIIKKFPGFYSSAEPESVLRRFLSTFGTTLDAADADLIKVMRAHWVDSADNADSKGFNTAQKGDLDKIFSLYLENLGGTSQLKQEGRPDGDEGKTDDDIYRQRIKGLISVLQNGASTREGIVAIVAANLGIVGDAQEAVDARNSIRIVEYLPSVSQAESHILAFRQAFEMENPNAVPEFPEIRIRAREEFSGPLANARLVNLTSGSETRYPGIMRARDVLAMFSDGSALLNGVSVRPEGARIELPPGSSHWMFEADVVTARGDIIPIGVFDLETRQFDRSAFSSDLVVDLSMTLETITPGSFMVCIPWDIPGFTEKLDRLADSPRNQIQYIVNKVRAAGVFSVIAYEKRLSDAQDLHDELTLRVPRREDHETEEATFDIGSTHFPDSGGMIHAMTDSLTLSGVFDMTGFDTLNTFAS